MPGDGICPLFKEVSRRSVVSTAMDEMNFRVALRSTGCGMNVVSTEVSTKGECVFDWNVCEVLVAKRDDLLLGDEESQFIFPGIGQLT
jgi:hypothetical protein